MKLKNDFNSSKNNMKLKKDNFNQYDFIKHYQQVVKRNYKVYQEISDKFMTNIKTLHSIIFQIKINVIKFEVIK